MSLKDTVLAASARPGPRCGFERVYATLPKRDATELREMFADGGYTTAQIRRGLTAAGFALAVSTVAAHRKGECLCGKL